MDQTQPELIFIDPRLADGTWLDIANLFENTSAPANLIVVGASGNAGLQASVMENGAFDNIRPPFELESLGHVVQHAVEDVRHRRAEQALRTVA